MGTSAASRPAGQEEKTFLSTAEVVQSVLEMLNGGKIAEAADLYSRCQDDIGFLLINKGQLDPKLQKLVANLFYRARDFDKAALCCENLGEFGKAAALYEQSDDYHSAAEMYARIENFEKAAEMFERNRNHQQAAELYLKVKNFSRAAINYEAAVSFFLAGRLFHELGKSRKAMELLQKVPAQDAEFEQATLLIGGILAKNGYPDLAVKKILGVIKSRPVGADTAELYYQLADIHSAENNLDVAKNIYQQLLAFDITYRDVEDKVRKLEEGLHPTSPGQAAAPIKVEPQQWALDLPPGVKPAPEIMGMMEGFDFLRNIPLFQDMPLVEMRAFYNICEERAFQEGERLIEQGSKGVALFVLRSGQASVQRLEGEKVVEVAVLGPGHHVGEMSLVDEAPTSARVVAKGKVVAFEISREQFLRFLQANDKFAVRVLRVFVRTLCQRLRETTAKLAGQ